MIETFSALSEPNRFKIVELLRGGPRRVSDISERLHLQQPQVSKHLRVLRDVGLVEVQARAQERLYELRPEPLRAVHDWLERYRGVWDARFQAMDEVVRTAHEKEKGDGRKRKR